MSFATELAKISNFREDKNKILKELLEIAPNDIIYTFKQECYEAAKKRRNECIFKISCFYDSKTTNSLFFKRIPDYRHIRGMCDRYHDWKVSWLDSDTYSRVYVLSKKLYPKSSLPISAFLRDYAIELDRELKKRIKTFGFEQCSVKIQCGTIELKAKW